MKNGLQCGQDDNIYCLLELKEKAKKLVFSKFTSACSVIS